MQTGRYRGRFSDGRSAGSRQVEVALARALEIHVPGEAEPERWSFHRLSANVPVTRRSADVLLKSLDHPGATLFVAEPGFAAALLAAAPRLSPGAHRWRYAVPGLLVTILVALIVGLVYLLHLNPSQSLAAMLPQPVRVFIGERAIEGLAGENPVCRNSAGRAALDRLMGELSQAAGGERSFRVQVFKWSLVNAFAVPGEQIVVSSALLDQARSPDELAGVLAHEMGHGIELHPEAGIVRSIGMSAALELIFSGQPGTLTNLGAALLQLRYSREAEHEADLHAIRILRNAGISPQPLADFFERLEVMVQPSDSKAGTQEGAKSGETGKGGDDASSDILTTTTAIFSTHPPSPERAKLAAEAANYEAHPALGEADWASLRQICDGA